MVPYSSSLIQALAGEVGNAMRDVDPLDVMRSARTVQRVFRGYRGRQRAKSARRGPMPTKKRRTASTPTARFQPSRRAATPMYQEPPDTGSGAALTLGLLRAEAMPVPSDTFSEKVDSQTLHVKGYKICREFYLKPGINYPVTVNWALIQLKAPITDADVQANIGTKFFRAGYVSNKKADNFGRDTTPNDEYSTAGDPWNMKLHCLPMNPDNGYNIITRKQMSIFPPNVQSQSGGDYPQNMKRVHYYQPVNRIMETTEFGAERWKNPVYEVMWTNVCIPENHPTDTKAGGVVDIVRTNKMHSIYFENKK